MTILFIELTLRKDTIKEIEKIFNSNQATKYIKAFHPNRDDYNTKIVTRIKNIKNQEEVRLLGLAKDIHIFTGIDVQKIQEKIEKGAKLAKLTPGTI